MIEHELYWSNSQLNYNNSIVDSGLSIDKKPKWNFYIKSKTNKTRSRTAIFSVNETQRILIVHTSNQFQKETDL